MNVLPNLMCFLSPQQDIATYYHVVDFFLSLYREDKIAYAISEAVDCGCEVIATCIRGQLYHEKISKVTFIKKDDPKVSKNWGIRNE